MSTHEERSFRFGIVAAGAPQAASWSELARKIEAHGFSTMVIPDGPGHLANPFPMLTWAAAATTTLRVGTYVLNQDLRHPLETARDAATLSALSGGRFELGLGSGRPGADPNYAEVGRVLDGPGVRTKRFFASVDVMRGLFAGETVTRGSDPWVVQEASLGHAFKVAPAPSILIAASGDRMLTYAANVADTIALGMDPTAGRDVAVDRVRVVREAAGDRMPELTINLVGVGALIHPWVRQRIEPQREALVAAGAPALLMGSVTEMTEQVERLRDELGITYITAAPEFLEALAPVVKALT